MKWGYALGCAFITLGIAKRTKDSPTEDSEESKLLTDEEDTTDNESESN